MELIPAIDLKGGKCVRLYQGDYSQETVFSDDPAGMAVKWASMGAPRLHLVDLDGAARGEPCHLAVIGDIARAISIPVQVGGGIRQTATIGKLLDAGVQRVILGTVAVEQPDIVEEAHRLFGDAVIVGIDARDGYVSTRGWQQDSRVTAADMIEQMTALGAKRFIYTDISRDGTLTQPNFDAIADLTRRTKLPIIASGGVTSIEHVKRLNGLSVEGAIVGRALYTGDMDLKEALATIQEKQ